MLLGSKSIFRFSGFDFTDCMLEIRGIMQFGGNTGQQRIDFRIFSTEENSVFSLFLEYVKSALLDGRCAR